MSSGSGHLLPEHDPSHDQSSHRVRFDWGTTGAAVVRGDVAVLVDVLSFSTVVTVAAEQGIEVFPHAVSGTPAAAHALKHAASVAVGPHEAAARADARHVSVAASDLKQKVGLDRLVVPDARGAEMARLLAESGATVIAGSLRNADAVADHVVRIADALGHHRSVVLIAAGEEWPDGSLRPCVEDVWGVGAIVAGLAERGLDDLSVEARTALGAYLVVEEGVRDALHQCASGRSLVEQGHGADVDLAADVSAASVVPVLRGESFSASRQ